MELIKYCDLIGADRPPPWISPGSQKRLYNSDNISVSFNHRNLTVEVCTPTISRCVKAFAMDQNENLG